METHDKNLELLSEKICSLRTAIFKVERNDAPLLITDNVIQTIKIDNDGYIWFYSSAKPGILNAQEDFHAQLYFHRKGASTRVHVHGPVSIVTTEENETLQNNSNCIPVLLKLKIINAYCYENAERTTGWWNKFLHTVKQLLWYNHLNEFDLSNH